MSLRMVRILVFSLICLSVSLISACQEKRDLEITMGKAGLQSMKYRGTELLVDGSFVVTRAVLKAWDGTLTNADLTAAKVSVDAAQQQVTYLYPWGTIVCQYQLKGDQLQINVKATNTSEIIIQGLGMQLMYLKFPTRPKGWDGATPHLSANLGWPTVAGGDYGTGMITFCNEDVTRPLISGFLWAHDHPTDLSFPIIASTMSIGWLGNLLDPYMDRPIYPGSSDFFNFSLRFTPSGANAEMVADDIFLKCAKVFPFKLKWDDRRPICSLILCNSATKYPTNPRGWWNENTIDVTTDAGRVIFKQRLMSYADTSIKIMKDMDAQGAIVWDIEGEEYPHATSYLGDPRSLPAEIDAVADEFFKKFRDAGLRIGICIRPQRPIRAAYGDGVWQSETVDPAQTLIDKIAVAKKRWGCTLFYVDSNGDPGVPMDALIFKKVAEAYPDVLLMPEQKTLRYYAYTAPYTELRGGTVSTPSSVLHAYPGAFCLINIADGALDQRRDELVAAVKRGDILMSRGWFGGDENTKIKSIYQDAKK